MENFSLRLELDTVRALLQDAKARLSRMTVGDKISRLPARVWLLDLLIGRIIDELAAAIDQLPQPQKKES